VSARITDRARGAARAGRRSIRELRSPRVRAGVGEGLRVGLRHASADYSSGLNEVPVQEVFAEYLESGQVVFDVGSNVGFYSLIAARLVGPSGEVHAFEAVPECARQVTANARRNHLRNISVHTVAVADAAGTVELLRSRHPGGATISAADRPTDFTEAIAVPSVALDGFVEAHDLPLPDFVKIDVEGAECQVLAGMERIMRTARPIVLCEVDDWRPIEAERKLDAVRHQLSSAQYSVRSLPQSYPGGRSLVLHALAVPD
jgi:FkbM family methyltransferase